MVLNPDGSISEMTYLDNGDRPYLPLLVSMDRLTQSFYTKFGYKNLIDLIVSIMRKTITLGCYESLIKDHYDVHDLIGQGFAADKLDYIYLNFE